MTRRTMDPLFFQALQAIPFPPPCFQLLHLLFGRYILLKNISNRSCAIANLLNLHNSSSGRNMEASTPATIFPIVLSFMPGNNFFAVSTNIRYPRYARFRYSKCHCHPCYHVYYIIERCNQLICLGISFYYRNNLFIGHIFMKFLPVPLESSSLCRGH